MIPDRARSPARAYEENAMSPTIHASVLAGVVALATPFVARAADPSPVPTASIPSQRLELSETVVQADRPITAASSLVVRSRDFSLRPIRRPADILEVAPGLVVVQHAGGGKANQYYLRGFDADHGTDVALSFDGVPINNPSHAHGQGYADMNWVIPEVVERLEVDKGPYFLKHGDFATAGAVNLVSRRAVTENLATFSAGRFDLYRGVVMGGRELDAFDTLFAVEGAGQDGPFVNPEDYNRYKLFARGGWSNDAWRSDLTFTSYRGTWNASGQIPLREVRAGRLDRFDSIDPSEGGTSQRHQLYARAAWKPDDVQEATVLAYGVYYDLDLFSNFTFFARDPVHGDEIEQKDKRFFGGGEVRYTRRFDVAGFETAATGAIGVRGDHIGEQLNYVEQRDFLARQTDHNVKQVNAFGYLGLDTTWTPWLRTVVGFRLDDLYFDVDNNLNSTTEPDLTGQGTENEAIVSPKASIVLSPLASTDVFLNYGEGFHSNDARGVVRDVNPVDPSAKARGAEVGVRTRLFDRLDVAAAFWMLDLDSEIVFVGDEGTTEPSGATRRIGGELEVRYRILDWLFFDVDYTQTVARFRFEPDAADDVPLAPRFTVNGGITARREDGLFGSIRTRAISSRPANEDDSIRAAGYTIWDLQLGKRFELPEAWTGGYVKALTLQLDIMNLFDHDYREAQFATDSRLAFEPEVVSDLNFTPGYPLTAIGSISLAF
jgi:outer membrane receptor protein involved in Fe transport